MSLTGQAIISIEKARDKRAYGLYRKALRLIPELPPPKDFEVLECIHLKLSAAYESVENFSGARWILLQGMRRLKPLILNKEELPELLRLQRRLQEVEHNERMCEKRRERTKQLHPVEQDAKTAIVQFEDRSIVTPTALPELDIDDDLERRKLSR